MGRLARTQILCYSVGHVLNDLTASCWFTYLLIFLQTELSLPEAGIVFLCGQFADGIATPLVGLMSDATNSTGWLASHLGKRKSWVAVGAVGVAIFFGFVFPLYSDDVGAKIASGVGVESKEGIKAMTIAVYGVAAALFNFGWATLQVNHLALVPELSNDDSDRVQMYSLRNAFAVLSNLAVFALYSLFSSVSEGSSVWRWLAISVIVLGALCTIIFLVGVRERARGADGRIKSTKNGGGGGGGEDEGRNNNNNNNNNKKNVTSVSSSSDSASGEALVMPNEFQNAIHEEEEEEEGEKKEEKGQKKGDEEEEEEEEEEDLSLQGDWKSWFSNKMFYVVMVVYMCARLTVNVSQVYVVLFSVWSLSMSKVSPALMPLAVYVAAFGANFAIKPLVARMKLKWVFCLGSVLACVAMALFGLLGYNRLENNVSDSAVNLAYVIVLLLGAGNAIILVSALSMEARLVGRNRRSGAFVYGAMSFADKLSNGAAVFGLNAFTSSCKGCENPDAGGGEGGGATESDEFRWRMLIVFTVLPAFASLMGGVVAQFLRFEEEEGYAPVRTKDQKVPSAVDSDDSDNEYDEEKAAGTGDVVSHSLPSTRRRASFRQPPLLTAVVTDRLEGGGEEGGGERRRRTRRRRRRMHGEEEEEENGAREENDNVDDGGDEVEWEYGSSSGSSDEDDDDGEEFNDEFEEEENDKNDRQTSLWQASSMLEVSLYTRRFVRHTWCRVLKSVLRADVYRENRKSSSSSSSSREMRRRRRRKTTATANRVEESAKASTENNVNNSNVSSRAPTPSIISFQTVVHHHHNHHHESYPYSFSSHHQQQQQQEQHQNTRHTANKPHSIHSSSSSSAPIFADPPPPAIVLSFPPFLPLPPFQCIARNGSS